MADAYIKVILDDEKIKLLESAELADQIEDIEGQKAILVAMTKKDAKKLKKGFPELAFDDSNACVLPGTGEEILMKVIADMKSLDVMKFAITKLYNPLAGRDVFGRGTGMR